ncbi:MAG: PD-(D/E)XK nuclease family protein [Oscillospiraceae bacterium]
MIEIICGRAHSSRGEMFLDRIKIEAESSDVLVVVPDQFSFESDKMLYKSLGAKLFNKIETEGIARLCDKICRFCGGKTLSDADDNAKYIAMYKAQAKLRSEGGVTYFKRSLLRPTFVSDCISLVGGLLRAGATPESVRAAAEAASSGMAKLLDISYIFAEYLDALEKMGLCDSISEASRAAALAKKKDFFKGKKVFFDSFASFSADELKLIECVLSQAESVVFSVVSDSCKEGQNPFALTQRTISRIERIANDHNRKVKIVRAGGCSQTEPLKAVNFELYSYRKNKINSEGLVSAAAAADVYEESEYVCAEINRLVRLGYRYSDIAVICGNIEETAQVFGNIAERYGIPYFVDHSRSALTSVPAKYLMSILDASLTREFKTENILRIVKSPLSPIYDYDACDLEDHCIKWRIEGEMWNSPFKLEPERSDRIEKTRQRIIEPLVRFKSACEDATAGDICKALFTLLDEFQMSKYIYSAVYAASHENETGLEVSRSFKQVWRGMITAIKSVYENMRDEKISLRAFSELLRLMLDSIKISAPPQKSDCVRIAQTGRSRISDVKILFVMQVNDGVFPKNACALALIGEAEIAALEKYGTELDDSPRNQLDCARMDVYSALTAPTERLYLSYSEADRTGSVCAPSDLIPTVCSIFEDDITVHISELDREFFCTSYKTAFYEYLAHSKDKTRSIANIKASLDGSEIYRERVEYVKKAAGAQDEALSEQMAKRLFFPVDLNLSATRVSDYYKCPFSYFCKYGLKLSSAQPVEINPLYIGNIAHSCLEHIMSKEENGKRVYDSGFTKLSDSELSKRIDLAADEYIREEMGGYYGKDLGFKFSVERLKKSILPMAVHFREELKHSLFVPAAFEYDLSGENGKSVLAVSLGDTSIQLRGKIDRADIYKTDCGTWLRIVDYKTGKQSFKEEEVYHGLNLQMLLYLLALTTGNSGLSEGDTLLPAGIMYSHIKFVSPCLSSQQVAELEDSGELEDRLMLERSKAYKPDGLMLCDEIIDGLNTEHEGVYTIFRFTSKGGVHGSSANKPISTERLKAMELFALGKVTEMGKRLKSGDIKADPIETDSGVVCEHCDYKALCKNVSPLSPRKVMPNDKELLGQELESIIAGGQAQDEIKNERS